MRCRPYALRQLRNFFLRLLGPGSSIRLCVLVELAEGAWYSLGEVVELQSVVVGGVQSTAVTARLLLGLLLSTTSHVAVDAAGVAALRPSTDSMQLSTAATNARPVKSPFAAKRR